ncbi:MAG: hypothetical protein BGO29_00305 [Bacteroidales bacterium 36-12]|nr:MAG: hypothetical protein BGO29_00305 [Bacteroidales bacterium 36-12]
MYKFNYLIASLIVALVIICTNTTELQAQDAPVTQTVSGVVVDNLGEPLVGVSIIVKGTNTNTVSNLEGKYSIKVPENTVLRFLYIGHIAQEIAVNQQETINVTMIDQFSQGLQMAKAIELTEKQNEIVEADNSFAFKMFKEVSKREGHNTFFSPLSLDMAMGMLYNGASGNTRNEIIRALGIQDFSATEMNEYYQKISQALLTVDPTTDITVANSIWYRNNFSVKKQFIEIGKGYFDANIQALSFNDSQSANIINNWCAEKTNNRIQNLIGNTIPNDMMMYLVNALYFKGQWQADIKFDREKTKLDNFTKTNGQKIKVNLMEKTSSLKHFSDEHLQCVEMDYGNRAFSMIVILPQQDKDINQLISYLDNKKLHDAVQGMHRKSVWLKLPRFKTECDFSLTQPIMDLGMSRIFKGGFKNISNDDLWVSDIIQKTFVEVNEEGTEAAAATTITMVGAAGRAKKIEPVRFFADRPFLYIIREKSTGVILFIGRMDEPKE